MVPSPKNCVTSAAIPMRGERNRIVIDTTTTVEMKYGAYATICTVDLKNFKRTSLSASARMIGTGKLARTTYADRMKVFCKTGQNTGLLKKRSKCLKPAQSLPHTPSTTL